ncbi:MAG: hypothetical protein IT367_12715 [Candidatus Hydrogenedentes bacterium]|nr:hypothetical protein [Candidatus Hydrogenedentota bacterium]
MKERSASMQEDDIPPHEAELASQVGSDLSAKEAYIADAWRRVDRALMRAFLKMESEGSQNE